MRFIFGGSHPGELCEFAHAHAVEDEVSGETMAQGEGGDLPGDLSLSGVFLQDSANALL